MSKTKAMTQPHQSFPDIDECERGNIWLVHVEEDYHNAYFRLTDNRWLEVSIRPCNYPGFNVKTITVSDAELAAHIRKEFGGGMWHARKMNLEGVELDAESNVVGDDEEDEIA